VLLTMIKLLFCYSFLWFRVSRQKLRVATLVLPPSARLKK